eukprot:CAMPEP_0117491904 /NCGR_PEP_ID=MMETSP0784-20121206/18307_1 /TAXON_ID=39447 /ORGANISM="" /LENGTH=336 /DNA_ID=CAMNT_0005286709 /DNA_START=68 /DNA_END=1078 /DNA_ORIENTATION=+
MDVTEGAPLATTSKRILVVGGSSYVAQFLIRALLDRPAGGTPLELHATHRPGRVLEGYPEALRFHPMDPTDAASVAAVLASVAPGVVVNCAAMSGLGPCEKDPTGAMLINCPKGLVEATAAQAAGEPRLFVHFSTDIVFDGDAEKVYDEESSPAPVNAYGRSKAEFDAFLADCSTPTCVVLRPTNILGPAHPYAITGKKFLQWVDDRLRIDECTKLFEDEYRNYVWVEDLVAVAVTLIEGFPTKPPAYPLIHCGGPEPLNRLDIAAALATAKRYGLSYKGEGGADLPRIVPVKRAEVDLGYPSPLCVRFASPRVESILGRPMRPVAECINTSVDQI